MPATVLVVSQHPPVGQHWSYHWAWGPTAPPLKGRVVSKPALTSPSGGRMLLTDLSSSTGWDLARHDMQQDWWKFWYHGATASGAFTVFLGCMRQVRQTAKLVSTAVPHVGGEPGVREPLRPGNPLCTTRCVCMQLRDCMAGAPRLPTLLGVGSGVMRQSPERGCTHLKKYSRWFIVLGVLA